MPVMDDQDFEDPEGKLENLEKLNAKAKASIALSGLLATGAFDGIAHLGLAGAVVGSVLTGILVMESPRIARKLRQDFPEVATWLDRRRPGRSEMEEIEDEGEEWSDEYGEEEISAFLADWEAAHQRAAPVQKEEEHSDVTLHLSSSWSPLADSILSQRLAIIGQPGSGKSNTVADVVEEIGPLEVPLLLLDTEGEYDGLCPRYLPRGTTLGAERVGLSNARALGQAIPAERRQVILNLQSYESDDEAAQVICAMIAGINEWEEAQPAGRRVSCMVILDEAAVWLPQAVNESVLSRTVLTQLQQTFFSTVVRRGRKRGIGFLLATQRIAEIDKRALSATWIILHRQTLPNDLKVYERFGIEEEAARNLRAGQAYVLGPDDFHEVVQFRKRHSQDKAFTPGLASVRNQTPRRASPARPAVSAQQIARTRARELRLRGTAPQPAPIPLRPLQAEAVERKKREINQVDLARAFAFWQAGYSSSVRTLFSAAQERGYSWSNGYCRELIDAMRECELIPKQKQAEQQV